MTGLTPGLGPREGGFCVYTLCWASGWDTVSVSVHTCTLMVQARAEAPVPWHSFLFFTVCGQLGAQTLGSLVRGAAVHPYSSHLPRPTPGPIAVRDPGSSMPGEGSSRIL